MELSWSIIHPTLIHSHCYHDFITPENFIILLTCNQCFHTCSVKYMYVICLISITSFTNKSSITYCYFDGTRGGSNALIRLYNCTGENCLLLHYWRRFSKWIPCVLAALTAGMGYLSDNLFQHWTSILHDELRRKYFISHIRDWAWTVPAGNYRMHCCIISKWQYSFTSACWPQQSV